MSAAHRPPTTGAFGGVQPPDDDLLVQCMHCGFCLPTCPTYTLTGMERSSPRGRIRLIKAVADGDLDISQTFQDEMQFCLGCRACETACPAGVQYGSLLESARAAVFAATDGRAQLSLLGRWMLRGVIAHPRRLKLLARLLRMAQRLRLPEFGLRSGLLRLIAPRLAALTPLQPTISPRWSDQVIPPVTPADPQPAKLRVGMITGCVMNVAFAEINCDTVAVLARNGCEVVTPRNQPCCGSLHGHIGDLETARALARRLIDTFERERVDAVVINSAGCGSFMKEYGHLLADDAAYAARARAFAAKVLDISELLVQLPWTPPRAPLPATTAAYHDACHLAHGQKVKSAPRALLDAVPGLRRVELPESDWCCGSAGIYNIVQPAAANALLARKLNNVRAAQPDILLAANPGCIIQLRAGAAQQGLSIEVQHPISLIARAYRQADASATVKM